MVVETRKERLADGFLAQTSTSSRLRRFTRVSQRSISASKFSPKPSRPRKHAIAISRSSSYAASPLQSERHAFQLAYPDCSAIRRPSSASLASTATPWQESQPQSLFLLPPETHQPPRQPPTLSTPSLVSTHQVESQRHRGAQRRSSMRSRCCRGIVKASTVRKQF